MGISASDLAGIRNEVEKYLPDPVTIRRKTKVYDAAGGSTSAYEDAPLPNPVPGRLEDPDSEELIRADRMDEVPRGVLKLPHGTDLRETDRVVVGGVTFEVARLVERTWAAYVVAEVEAV